MKLSLYLTATAAVISFVISAPNPSPGALATACGTSAITKRDVPDSCFDCEAELDTCVTLCDLKPEQCHLKCETAICIKDCPCQQCDVCVNFEKNGGLPSRRVASGSEAKSRISVAARDVAPASSSVSDTIDLLVPPPNCASCQLRYVTCLAGCRSDEQCIINCKCDMCADKYCHNVCGYNDCCEKKEGHNAVVTATKEREARNPAAAASTHVNCQTCKKDLSDCLNFCDNQVSNCNEQCQCIVSTNEYCHENCGFTSCAITTPAGNQPRTASPPTATLEERGDGGSVPSWIPPPVPSIAAAYPTAAAQNSLCYGCTIQMDACVDTCGESDNCQNECYCEISKITYCHSSCAYTGCNVVGPQYLPETDQFASRYPVAISCGDCHAWNVTVTSIYDNLCKQDLCPEVPAVCRVCDMDTCKTGCGYDCSSC